MPLLTVKNLSLQRGSTTLFGGMDLAIEAGLNAITGDEGVGKTALLHFLAGDLTDASGDRVGPNAFLVAPPDEVALQLTPLQRWELLAKNAPLWKQALCEDLYHALDLAEHLHKSSSCSRRARGRKWTSLPPYPLAQPSPVSISPMPAWTRRRSTSCVTSSTRLARQRH